MSVRNAKSFNQFSSLRMNIGDVHGEKTSECGHILMFSLHEHLLSQIQEPLQSGSSIEPTYSREIHNIRIITVFRYSRNALSHR